MPNLIVRLNGKRESVPITDAQAQELRSRIERDAKSTEAVSIAGNLFRIQQIESILSDGPIVSTKLAAKGTEGHRAGLRTSLREAALNCKTCPRVAINGKTFGRGFVDNPDGSVAQCGCQRTPKMLLGVEPDEMDALYPYHDKDIARE